MFYTLPTFKTLKSLILSSIVFSLALSAGIVSASEKKLCEYGGNKYSHGAVICQANTKQECDDGVWVDKKESCISSQSTNDFTLDEQGFSAITIPAPDAITNISDNVVVYTDTTVSGKTASHECIKWERSGSPDISYISNICRGDRPFQATVKYLYYGGRKRNVVYRLPANTFQKLNHRGVEVAEIVSVSNQIDFHLGEDASNSTSIHTYFDRGFKLWSFRNYTNRYVVYSFKGRRSDPGNPNSPISGYGLVAPGTSTVIWYENASEKGGENSFIYLDSVRYEPVP